MFKAIIVEDEQLARDLIKDFALKPSPLFKKILRQVEEARISQKIKNKDEAILLVKDILKT